MTPRFVFAALFALCALCTFDLTWAASVPKGFVSVKGSQFQLNGRPFNFVGANSYWLPLLTEKKAVDQTFKQMRAAGVKVLRTWGFNGINGTELAGALESDLTYYQLWNGPEWELNEGPNGLQRMDYVLEAAAKHDIKVILTFTNNWSAYGGLEFYVQWIGGAGATHDTFYTDPRIVASYQRYVKTLVNRYKDSPAIFAWELANEARCRGDLPTSSACPKSGMLTEWYHEQSAFIRSLDKNHMITTGGEGHFFWKDPEDPTLLNDYNYNGEAGEDFDADLALPNIDFGVYHIYPQYWYAPRDYPSSNFSLADWGVQWIKQHAEAAKKANKPVVLEEFGYFGLNNKTQVFPRWVGAALQTKQNGVMPWQFGALDLVEPDRVIKYADAIIDGDSPNDGHTIYKNQTFVYNIFTAAAAVQKLRSL